MDPAAEVDRLRRECAEAYQVAGELARRAGLFGRPDLARARTPPRPPPNYVKADATVRFEASPAPNRPPSPA